MPCIRPCYRPTIGSSDRQTSPLEKSLRRNSGRRGNRKSCIFSRLQMNSLFVLKMVKHALKRYMQFWKESFRLFSFIFSEVALDWRHMDATDICKVYLSSIFSCGFLELPLEWQRKGIAGSYTVFLQLLEHYI